MAETPVYSRKYAMGYHESVLKMHGNRTAPIYAAYLLPHIQQTDHILDVGCGPGSITIGLAEKAPQGHTIGIDYGPEAIEAARALAVDKGVTKNCEFKTGNAYALEWADETFDVVHSHQCLIHLDDPVKAFKEMRRVCKVGGIVAIRDADLGTLVMYPFDPLLNHMTYIFSEVMRSYGSDPNNGRRLIALARQAGFQRSECQVSAAVEIFCNASEREFIATRYCERLLKSDLGAMAAKLEIATLGEMEAVAEAWMKWIGDVDGYYSMTNMEIICRKVN